MGKLWERAQNFLQCTIADVPNDVNCRESYALDLGLFMASPSGLAFKTLRVWMRLCVRV